MAWSVTPGRIRNVLLGADGDGARSVTLFRPAHDQGGLGDSCGEEEIR